MLAAFLLVTHAPAQAQDVPRAQVDSLARDVARVESLRAVKDLQRTYAQYGQFALWDEMAALFADDATFIWGEERSTGREAIAALAQAPSRRPARTCARRAADRVHRRAAGQSFGRRPFGEGPLDGPDDGGRRQGQDLASTAASTRTSTCSTAASLEDLPCCTSSRSTRAITRTAGATPAAANCRSCRSTSRSMKPASRSPQPAGAAPRSDATLAALEQRIAALNDEDDVRNLQNAYGYYVDRKMWDDVVDLFADDGVVEIAGVGTFKGKDGVRRAMERMGPQGLQQGELNDHPIFDTIVTVQPGRQRGLHPRPRCSACSARRTRATAALGVHCVPQPLRARGRLVEDSRAAPLSAAQRRLRGGLGQGRRRAPRARPAGVHRTPPGDRRGRDGRRLRRRGQRTAHRRSAAAAAATPTGTRSERLADARAASRARTPSTAWSMSRPPTATTSTISSGRRWRDLRARRATSTRRSPATTRAATGSSAAATADVRPATRRRAPGISFHWRIQPVIHVSHDGRSANLRTRLFQPRTGKPQQADDRRPGFNSASLSAACIPTTRRCSRTASGGCGA